MEECGIAMLFILCEYKGDDYLTKMKTRIKESLNKAGIKNFRIEHARLRDNQACWIGAFAKECLYYDEDLETEAYDYRKALHRVKRELKRLQEALLDVARMPEVELAAITNIPGTWPWGPETIEMSEHSEIFALFVPYNIRTRAGDLLIRSLLFKLLITSGCTGDSATLAVCRLCYSLLLTPFLATEELVRMLKELKVQLQMIDIANRGVVIIRER